MNEQNSRPTSVELARQAAIETADGGQDAVGDFLRREDLGGGVYDYRFDSGLKGYEQWEWAVTLYHDVELDEWTVNEATLLPTKRSLVAPEWIPFRDRLPRQSDEDVEEGLEPGIDESEGGQQRRDRDGRLLDPDDSDEDIAEAINTFYLSRRLVPSPKGLQDTAQRWEDGRTRLHRRSQGVTDAFVVPLEGFLGRFYGVCTNKHCRYDGKVVPLDHSCADPEQFDDDLYRDLWPENDPLVDSEHIDVFDDRHHGGIEKKMASSDGDSPADSTADEKAGGQEDDEGVTVVAAASETDSSDTSSDEQAREGGDNDSKDDEPTDLTEGTEGIDGSDADDIDDESEPDDDDADSDEEEDDTDVTEDDGEGAEEDEDQDDPTVISDPRHHKVIESLEDMAYADDADVDDVEDDGADESLLEGGDDADPRRARAVQQGFTRIRRRRRRG